MLKKLCKKTPQINLEAHLTKNSSKNRDNSYNEANKIKVGEIWSQIYLEQGITRRKKGQWVDQRWHIWNETFPHM